MHGAGDNNGTPNIKVNFPFIEEDNTNKQIISSHCTDEKTEVQKGTRTCQMSHSKYRSPDSNLGSLDSQAQGSFAQRRFMIGRGKRPEGIYSACRKLCLLGSASLYGIKIYPTEWSRNLAFNLTALEKQLLYPQQSPFLQAKHPSFFHPLFMWCGFAIPSCSDHVLLKALSH